MMKTIWILNHHAIPPQIGGGTRHYDFGKELIKRGYKVYIFASSFIHYHYYNLLEDGEQTREELIDGIHWIWINTRAYHGNGKDRILGMVDYYRSVMNIYPEFPKPDIVIGSAVHLLACVAGYKVSKKLNAEFISEIRDLWPETLIELGSLKRNSVIARILYALEKYVYKRSEKVIVTAPGMIDYIARRGIKKERIHYINNGVDIQTYDERKQANDLNDTPVRFNRRKFNVVYLGSIGTANALDTLINAAKIIMDMGIADIQFTLVGNGPLTEKLKKNAEDLRLKNIEFFSSVAKQYVPGLLSYADCLVFSANDSPLYRYGVSANKLFDYLCSSKPIIFAMNTINDFIKESGCGISIKPEDAAQMAEAILEIYDMSEEERSEMGSKGRAFVEKNYDIPILVNKLEEVINT